jgi:hypothetical protein
LKFKMSSVDAAPTGGCGADHPYDGKVFGEDRNRKMVGGRRSKAMSVLLIPPPS